MGMATPTDYLPTQTTITPWAWTFTVNVSMGSAASVVSKTVRVLTEAEAKAEKLLAWTMRALEMWRRWLRSVRITAPAKSLWYSSPTRTCSLSGSWRAQGPP